MKKYFFIFSLALSHFAYSQKIINAVLVGDKGITEDQKKAKFLIVVKSYADTAFERLEYNFAGPMKRRLAYKDPLLKISNGTYTDFNAAGYISTQGNYSNNKKDGSWFKYNDTGKTVLEYRYHLDTLIEVINSDSLEIENKKLIKDTMDEHEAEYRGGQKKYLNYINKTFTVPSRTQSLQTGGSVRVQFIVDKEGKVINVHIKKSVEFAFDEEVMRVVSSAKDWLPASQKGRKVNAYREQPITISFK